MFRVYARCRHQDTQFCRPVDEVAAERVSALNDCFRFASGNDLCQPTLILFFKTGYGRANAFSIGHSSEPAHQPFESVCALSI